MNTIYNVLRLTIFITVIIALLPKDVLCQVNIAENKEAYDLVLSTEAGTMSLETIIGIEELPDSRYLLASPGQVGIAANGDICVFDEYSIKVYNPHGMGKMIVGRKGEGPGEFISFPQVIISPTGFISAAIIAPSTTFISIFSPDYSFIDSRRFNFTSFADVFKNDYKPGTYLFLKKAYAMSEHEILFFIQIGRSDLRKNIYYVVLVNTATNKASALFRDEWQLQYPEIPMTSGYEGTYYFDMLTEKYIIYLNPSGVRHYSDEKGEFDLGIYSINDRKTDKLTIEFVPEIWTKEKLEGIARLLPNRNAVKKTLEKKRYTTQGYILNTDNMYCYLYYRYTDDNEYNTIIYIIDAAEKTLIKRVLYQATLSERGVWSRVAAIKNKRMYVSTRHDGFPAFYVYKLDPKIWEKN